ncbi:MAG: hypothetical protein LBS49_01815 [Candidatus Accumulibacter sp.]|jgi:hypothetical protein|nr:hypothetical protein [Accumulibacter sp.]
MHERIVDIDALPQHLMNHIHSRKVRVREADGMITLIPLAEKTTRRYSLFGMLAGSGLSTDEYCAQKQIDKTME